MEKPTRPPEEPQVERFRRLIEQAYLDAPTGCGGSFGELLCHEIHSVGCTFIDLAKKWGVSLPTLGELIHDHCKRLEPDPDLGGVDSERKSQYNGFRS